MPKSNKHSEKRIVMIVFAVIAAFIQIAEFLFVLIFIFWFISEGPLESILERTSDKIDDQNIYTGDIEDWLYEDKKHNITIQVFQMDGKTCTVDGLDTVDVYEPLEDGHFYEIIADATILNGGVAGYYNYPQIEKVSDCREISPFDLDLPSIKENHYGLVLIGDYSEGDLFLYSYDEMAVWKDNEWIWRYSEKIDRSDGSVICCRSGISEDEIQEGIDNGILACEDYFLLPAIKK